MRQILITHLCSLGKREDGFCSSKVYEAWDKTGGSMCFWWGGMNAHSREEQFVSRLHPVCSTFQGLSHAWYIAVGSQNCLGLCLLKQLMKSRQEGPLLTIVSSSFLNNIAWNTSRVESKCSSCTRGYANLEKDTRAFKKHLGERYFERCNYLACDYSLLLRLHWDKVAWNV